MREETILIDVMKLQDGKDVKVYKLTDKRVNYLNVHEEELKEALRIAESL